jgi:hypothetical protein
MDDDFDHVVRSTEQLVGLDAERSAARRQHDPGDLATGVGRGPQALVDRAMLTVDRDQLGPRCRPQRLHHRPRRDQALLVGQRQPLPRGEGGDGDREPGETDDAVHHDVGRFGEHREVVDDLGERQRGRDLGAAASIGHGDELGTELSGLGDERLDR